MAPAADGGKGLPPYVDGVGRHSHADRGCRQGMAPAADGGKGLPPYEGWRRSAFPCRQGMAPAADGGKGLPPYEGWRRSAFPCRQGMTPAADGGKGLPPMRDGVGRHSHADRGWPRPRMAARDCRPTRDGVGRHSHADGAKPQAFRKPRNLQNAVILETAQRLSGIHTGGCLRPRMAARDCRPTAGWQPWYALASGRRSAFPCRHSGPRPDPDADPGRRQGIAALRGA
jgi:hypothetical protein